MFRSRPRATLCLIAFWISCVVGPANAEVDKTLQDAAKTEVTSYLETLEKLVTTESGSDDTDGLLAVAEQLEQHLTALGFATSRHRSNFGAKADTIVGSKAGSGQLRVMLLAHFDTVYERGILEASPYRVEEDRIYGPGVADAKGGIAMILHTLKILNDAGWDDFATISVVFNADEEIGSPGSHEIVTKLASEAGTVLSFEPTWTGAPVPYYLVLGHAAYAQVRLEVRGVAAHASQPEKGKNAVIELAHQLVATKDIADRIQGAQLNWTNVTADQAYNQIPDFAVALGDGRITEPGADEKLLAALKEQVETDILIPGTEATVGLEILRPMLLPTKEARALFRLANRIHAEIGLPSFYPVEMIKGATDAGYAALSGKTAVLESFGPSGDGYHATDEHILISSIEPRLYLTARLLMELGASR